MARARSSNENQLVFKVLWLMIGILVFAATAETQTPHGSQSAKPSGNTTPKGNFRFEVFSIKRNMSIQMPGGAEILPDGFRATGAPISDLIMDAYNPLPPMRSKIRNLPDWARNEFYDVDARVESDDVAAWSAERNNYVNGHELLRAAMQSALKDRCKLALHIVSEEAPYYSLVVGKHGIKLHAVPDAQPQKGMVLAFGGKATPFSRDGLPGWNFHAATMQSLAAFLTIVSRSLPVQDKTGLKGQYDFSLQSQSDDQAEDVLARMPVSQVGLELKPDKGPSFTIVIDHIERPDQN